MTETKELLKKEIIPNLITLAAGVLVIFLVFGIRWYKEKNIPECTQSDIYEIKSEWGVCSAEGKQTREILKKEVFSCKNPGKVDVPEKERSCVYIPVCHGNDCLFKKGIKEHTTIIENGDYSIKNHNNLEIAPHGKFKNIKLFVIADTQFGKIPEYYYIFFGIDKNYASPRVLGTSRIQSSRFDLKDYGVFQGTETPKTLSFDLKNLKLANTSKEGNGSQVKDYVEMFNKYSDQKLKMTLFLADGNSMTENDVKKRIFGIITDAWFEYECETNEACSIERVPSITQ